MREEVPGPGCNTIIGKGACRKEWVALMKDMPVELGIAQKMGSHDGGYACAVYILMNG